MRSLDREPWPQRLPSSKAPDPQTGSWLEGTSCGRNADTRRRTGSLAPCDSASSSSLHEQPVTKVRVGTRDRSLLPFPRANMSSLSFTCSSSPSSLLPPASVPSLLASTDGVVLASSFFLGSASIASPRTPDAAPASLSCWLTADSVAAVAPPVVVAGSRTSSESLSSPSPCDGGSLVGSSILPHVVTHRGSSLKV